MKILRIIFEGFNKTEGRFANCVLLLDERLFSVPTVYELSVRYNYPVCSDLKIEQLIENRCVDSGGSFLECYNVAKKEGYSFTVFASYLNDASNPFKVHRFSESDFEIIIKELGGYKIPETIVKTPDFLINDVVLELKDIQTDSLEVKERQNSIGIIFRNTPGYTVNLDPLIDYGNCSAEYHRLLSATVQKHFKKASEQTKSFQQTNKIFSAGVILINTGMYSLPHDKLKEIVEHILQRQTQTIKFAFIVSQVMQSNGFDLYSVFRNGFVGDVPNEITALKERMKKIIDYKMKEMIMSPTVTDSISSMSPISFLSENKIFYWNPGRIKDNRISNVIDIIEVE